MFTAGAPLPEADEEETREYEAVAVEQADPEALEEPGETDGPVAVEEIDDGIETEVIEDPGETEPSDEKDEIDDGLATEEDWEDEYEEWDDEPGSDGEVPEDAPPAEGEPSGPGRAEAIGADLRTWFAAFAARSRTIGAGALRRIGEIRIPRHEIDGLKALAAGGILLIALLVGAGGYVLGKGSGDDIDQARLEGEFAGRKAGAIEGATRGYAAGFKKGRDLSFRKSYEASYRRNYIRAYENAGMDAPKPENIEVPKP